MVTIAAAQDTQRLEIFGGYSLLHGNLMLPPDSNFSGWDASATVFFNNWCGMTSDFAGHYGSNTYVLPGSALATDGKAAFTDDAYSFLFGPRIVHRWSRYAPFAQTLFGVTRDTSTGKVLIQPTCEPLTCGQVALGSFTNTGFSMALGGGLDIDIGHGIALRPVRAEYLLRRSYAIVPEDGMLITHWFNHNDFRYSGGIIFRLGPHLSK